MIEARIDPTFQSWREAARLMLHAGTDPANVLWTDGDTAALPVLAATSANCPAEYPEPI